MTAISHRAIIVTPSISYNSPQLTITLNTLLSLTKSEFLVFYLQKDNYS